MKRESNLDQSLDILFELCEITRIRISENEKQMISRGNDTSKHHNSESNDAGWVNDIEKKTVNDIRRLKLPVGDFL